MAVFYKWLKGCESGASLDVGQWSYITWGGKTGSTSGVENVASDTDTTPGTWTTEIMPTLQVSIGRKEESKLNDVGYFLTNKMPTPWFESDFVENKILYFTDNEPAGSSFSDVEHTSFQQQEDFQITSTTNVSIKATDKEIHLQTNFKLDKDGNVETNKNFTLKEALAVLNTCQVGGNAGDFTDSNKNLENKKFSVTGDSYFDGMIKVSQQCEAQWFNATSDARAKENLQPATYSALELIDKLPIYTYNYKNNTETVTGILAQDLLIAQPKELELVSNINASGENNDYMSIKNDKLMFVLMKAIQEQQEQIKELKSEIENLKKTI